MRDIRNAADLSDTTSDVCHRHIKPATTPEGWECIPEVVNAEKSWYKHTYRKTATGTVQDEPPTGTMAYADVLQRDPAKRDQVGRAKIGRAHV